MSEQANQSQSAQGAAAEAEGAPRPSRRIMLKVITAGATGAAAGVGGAMLANRAGRGPVSRWRFFTEAEASLVEAICEQIIPADQDPGARDAGVVNFIDRQLVGPYARFAEQYRKGLASVQDTCREMFGRNFEQIAWEQQTQLLVALEQNKAPKAHWITQSAGAFFDLIRQHTMQGFYGSPRHGGNRDYVSYRMLGIEYPRVMGRNVHQ